MSDDTKPIVLLDDTETEIDRIQREGREGIIHLWRLHTGAVLDASKVAEAITGPIDPGKAAGAVVDEDDPKRGDKC